MTHSPIESTPIDHYRCNSRPTEPQYSVNWDVSTIKGLRRNEDLSLKNLPGKLALLMAQVSASELHALDLRFRRSAVQAQVSTFNQKQQPRALVREFFYDKRQSGELSQSLLSDYQESQPDTSTPPPTFLFYIKPHKSDTSQKYLTGSFP